MVASLSAIQSAGAAASYFKQVDDYYHGEEMAPSAWFGYGVQRLGLNGQPDSRSFQDLLSGKLPDGRQLGRIGKDGRIEHKPGWDLTFSAPKSVSIMGLVEGDERLIRAHEQAVHETLIWLEQAAAVTRVKERGGEAKIEATGNLAAATFRHSTNREAQPQLHTHAVILNMTQREDGQWRSLESRPLYRLQMEAGERYRAALAMHVRELGYQVEQTRVGESRGFDIQGVSRELIKRFSDRSEQVVAALAARGKTRETATAEEKDMAAVSSRKAKEAVDHAKLHAEWRRQAQDADLAKVKTDAQALAIGPASRVEIQQAATHEARNAIAEAAQHLAERSARFTDSALMQEARRLALGKAGEADLRAAVTYALAHDQLEARTTRAFNPQTGQIVESKGYATREAIKIEEAMLAAANRARAAALPLAKDAAVSQLRQEVRSGFRFNEGQANALAGFLTSTDRISLIQGYAGTAKTTSVLAAVAGEAKAKGLQVTALAPTRSAADTLGRAIDAQGITVAKHATNQSRAGGIWIVDEASMVSAKDMAKLLQQAEQVGARVILVGDVKQLGSVEAGAAFRQLQAESGLKTYVLDEIVRQENQMAREAVEAAIKGNAAEAMAKLEAGGGSVHEMATRDGRIAAIANDYTRQSAEARAASIVIAPGKDDRQLLNDAIRERLAKIGVLIGQAASTQTLTVKDLTETQAKRALNYQEGDILKAGRAYRKWGIERGDYLHIRGVDAARNIIMVEHNGNLVQINPRITTRFQAFEAERRELQQGDQIVFKANDEALKRKNGLVATVVKLDAAAGRAIIQTAKGEYQSLDLRSQQHGHWSHAYAQTAHEAQGRTCDRVFIHAESGRLNLTNQQSLYVAISRAKQEAHVYTDNKEELGLAVSARTGQKEQALQTWQEQGHDF